MQGAAGGIYRIAGTIGDGFAGQQGPLVGRGQGLIPARRHLTGDVERIDRGRKARTQHLDGFGVSPRIRPGLPGERVESGKVRGHDQLRTFVVEADRIYAEVVVIGAPFDLQPALPRVFGILVLAMVERQRLRPRKQRRANQKAFVAITKSVRGGKVAAGTGQAVGLPFELIVTPHRHVRRELQLPRHLLHRADQLLELRVGDRQTLHYVDGRHAARDAVHAVEQALAPLHGVLADAPRNRHVAQLTLAVHKGVEQFALTPVQLAGVIGEVVMIHRIAVGGARGVIVVLLVVDIVVPRRAAQTCTEVLVADVELRKQVKAAGDQAFTEVTVAIVAVERTTAGAGELAGRALGAPGGAVLESIVPAGTDVRVAGVEVKGLCHGHTAAQGGQG